MAAGSLPVGLGWICSIFLAGWWPPRKPRPPIRFPSLDDDCALHATFGQVGHRPAMEAGTCCNELHLNCTTRVEFEPCRRAVHVHLKLLYDDLVHPHIAEQVGEE